MVIIESPDNLSTWLTKELSPICDADPGALAKYVLALLKKPDKSDDEVKDICLLQLDVFLQSHTKRFVEKLFTALSERSYVEPSSSTPAPVVEKKKDEKKEEVKRKETPKEKPSEKPKEPSPSTNGSSTSANPAPSSHPSSSSSSSSTSRRVPATGSNSIPFGKREAPSDPPPPGTNSTNTSSRRSPVRVQRKRISPPPAHNTTRRRSRSPRGNRRVATRRSPTRKERRSRSRSPIEKDRRRDRDDDTTVVKKKKKRCRDFDELGFCTSGDKCQFDHGPDPVVVDDSALAGIGLAPKSTTSTVGAPPTTFNVPPPGYNPIVNPPPPGVEGVGYNPEAPGLSIGDFSVPPPPLMGQWRPNPYGVVGNVGYEPSGSIPVDPHNGGMMNGMGGGVMRGRGRGRGRGSFHPYSRGGGVGGGNGVIGGEGVDGGVQKEGLLPPTVQARTLIVKKVPIELNNISKLNEHFEQFGTITNMQVHYEGASDAALITYSNRFEATKAYKNPEPIFNNRFIRVFWYANITEGAAKSTTLSSGVTVETPGDAASRAPKEPVVLPGPGQTKYKNPERVEAFKKAKEEAIAKKAEKEKTLKLNDCLRRSTKVLSEYREQQKQLIILMMKETQPEKKKQQTKMYKMLDMKINDMDKEVERLQKLVFSAKKEDEGEGGGSSSGGEGGEGEGGSPIVKEEEGERDEQVPTPDSIDDDDAAINALLKEEMVE